MLQILNSFLTVQALYVAAVLRIPDRLADGPRTADELAGDAGADRSSLYRLMRMLTGAGVFREEPDGLFVLTPLGATLKSTGPDSVRDWALFIGDPDMWNVWSHLLDSVVSGQSSFEPIHEVPLWEFLTQHPDLGDAFNRWMTRQSDQHNDALVSAYDFSAFKSVADVGGGQGSTLAAILRSQPSLRGILIDLPSVVADTTPLSEAGVLDRCRVIGGDILQGVPDGAEVYLIKRVLMDWGDTEAKTILRHCANALPDGGKVLVVEMLMPTGNDPSPGKPFDILMLVNQPGGRIRTEVEFRELFRAAGLRLNRIVPTGVPHSVIEAVRA
ncbi:MAG: methyltransferase [Candidatus Dormibacteraceae bacterium]